MNRFQAWYRAQPRALRALLTINVVLYVVWQFVLIHISGVGPSAPGRADGFIYEHFALNPGFPGLLFEPWQLITYNFLHLSSGLGGFLHILFNMLWLVWVGRDYEELYGPHRLLSAYLLGGLGGGLLTVLLHAALPGAALFGGTVHGASASVLGVLTTVAVLNPEKSIALIFIGTIRLIWVVVAFLVLDLLFIAGSNTSISAHLGGAFAGFLLARAEGSGTDLSSWARVFFRDRQRRASPRTSGPRRTEPDPDASFLARLEGWLARRGGGKKPPKPKRKPSGKAKITRLRPSRSYDAVGGEEEESGLESEVDRILDKISEEGYDALSEEEKRILYEASRR